MNGRWLNRSCLLALAGPLLCGTLHAQRGGPPQPPPPPRAGAPVDLTGYWVSLVTEDWRFRIVTPAKGDFTGVPLNPAGRQMANQWDPARDEAAGEQCKAYGVGGIMRMPGRLHIVWQNDETMNLETDAGAQTRTFGFRGARTSGGDWQGVSVASWDQSASVMGAGGFFAAVATRGGSMKVITTNMRPGYLRKNGVPYSADAVVTEYFDRFDVPNGDSLLVVSTEVVDPTYLAQPFWTSSHFKKERDASGWKPAPCSAR
jgi:hypothetical protein